MSKTNTVTIAPTATFGMKLLAREAAAKPGENIMISPLSVAVALAMAANGARGNTLAGITSTLGLGDVDQSTSNAAYAELLSELKRDKIGVTLAVANAIFARQGVDFYESFLNANRDSFGARVDVLDFDAPETVDSINDWIGESTQQKITKLLEEIDPLTIMYLINCVYFKGEWTVKFDKDLTEDQPFTTAGGSAKDHPLMYRSADMVYGRGEAYTYISLPFGESKDVRLIAFLPQGDKSTADVIAALSADDAKQLTYAIANTYESEGELWLPRFDLEYENTLNDSLQALGMADAFSSATADFGALRPTPPAVYISEVKHKTVFKVDEEGAEGAAATSVGFGLESVSFPFEIRFDRPFVTVVADSKTNAILFAGVVNDPK